MIAYLDSLHLQRNIVHLKKNNQNILSVLALITASAETSVSSAAEAEVWDLTMVPAEKKLNKSVRWG